MNPPSHSKAPKRDFLGKLAPPGYVAGIGRGATGFTTRSDIGPAREAAVAAAAAAAVAASAASLAASSSSSALDETEPSRKLARRMNNDEDEEDEYLNEKNYDEFEGYGGSLVSKDPYEEDDEEADKIYDAIDKHLDERGKALRESKTRQELERYRQERPKIQQQFSDLKASLRQVSEHEWTSIPDVGDARNRKQRAARQDIFTPVPDSLLAHQARIARGGDRLVYIDPKNMRPDEDDEELAREVQEPDVDDDDDDDEGEDEDSKEKKLIKASSATMKREDNKQGEIAGLNIEEVSEFRSNFMKIKLNRNSQPVDGQVAAQASRDYLTNLQSMIPSQITDASTLKEYRKQFSSLRSSNPNFPNAWIASVRLEEAAGKLKAARALILEGCEKCPKSADLWCEAVRLHPSDLAKALMVRGLKEIPRSVKLWIKAADLETDIEAKRKVFAKARELVPKSVLLWKKCVELEEPSEARVILREAVECCPEAAELWLALARLVPYEEAQRVLIKASEQLPGERAIWIMAAKLEEAAGNKSIVSSILSRSIEQLETLNGKPIDRDEWLAEAVDAERAQFTVTCHELVRLVLQLKGSQPVEPEVASPPQPNIKKEQQVASKSVEDVSGKAKHREQQQQQQEARLRLWLEDARRFLQVERAPECARAVYECIMDDSEFSRQESNWIAFAQFERDHGKSEDTVELVLRRAVQEAHCKKSETLWLMLVDEKRRLKRPPKEARKILVEALDANPESERIILVAVELECEHSNHKEARRILADACMSAKSARLVLRSAQLEWSLGNLDEAVRMLKAATQEYKDEAELYLMLASIEEQRGKQELAKEHYSSGLKFAPTSVQLWIGLAKAEERMGNLAKARSKLEMARLRNPRVVSLWLEAARLELRAMKRGKNASIAINILAKGIKECKASPDCELLYKEQALISKR